jgi:hypothetical protein
LFRDNSDSTTTLAAGEMASTDQGLRHIVPGDGAESNKGDEGKRETEAREGGRGEAIEKGSCHILVALLFMIIIKSRRHT